MKKLQISLSDNRDFEDSSDSDDCDSEEIDRLFPNCDLISERKVNKEDYVLHVSATRFVWYYILLSINFFVILVKLTPAL